MSDVGPRVLPLEGVHNFRDFGDYAVVGGGRVRRGMLWRSGQHAGATDADLARIGALGLTAVFDLRSPVERSKYPCRRPEGFAGEVIYFDESQQVANAAGGSEEQLAPHLAAALQSMHHLSHVTDAAAARQGMLNTYRAFPTRRAQVAMMRRYFAGLARIDGPSLVNCLAGKDRTGIAVAFVQHALGVHHDDIIADYLLTETAGNSEARIEAGRQAIARVGGNLAPDTVAVVMGVDAEWLNASFAEVAQDHGRVDAYLAKVLGVDAGIRAALRDRLVAG